MEKINARQDNLTLIELSYMLDRVVIQVALNRPDLIVEHKSVDEHRTYLTEEDRRYVLRILSCKVKEETLLTSLSCEKCKSAVEFPVGIS